MNLARRISASLVLACAAGVAASARAQDYPTRTIRMLMPIPAGSLTDVVGRAIANSAGPVLGQPVVGENRAGANGTIGMAECAKAKPDGYTICMTDGNIMTINPFAYEKLPYDPKAFVPVAHLADLEVAFAVKATLPIHDVKELVAYAKSRPGEFAWGTTGAGSTPHMYLEWFQAKTGIRANHISYKGPSQLQLALTAGEIDASNMGPATIVKLVAAGKLRMIAVSHGSKRSRWLGDTPSFKDQGFDIDYRNWLAIVLPPGAPRPIASRWNAEINKLLADPAWVEKVMTASALTPMGGTPEDLVRIIEEKSRLGAELTRIAKLKYD